MKIIALIIALTFGFTAYAQVQKIKILLVGTIHFANPHTDQFELKADDFLSAKRVTGIKRGCSIMRQPLLI